MSDEERIRMLKREIRELYWGWYEAQDEIEKLVWVLKRIKTLLTEGKCEEALRVIQEYESSYSSRYEPLLNE